MNEMELKNRLAFLQQAERLKDTLRSGYTGEGRPESVAAHTWRLTLLIMTFADLMPKMDLLRLLKICVIHDLGEAINGDIPAPLQVGRASKSAEERQDFQSLIADLPQTVQAEFIDLWDDYEYGRSDEARMAKAFDKIETLLQHNQGKNPANFDYAFNLDYGREQTDADPLAAKIRALIDVETAANDARTKQID